MHEPQLLDVVRLKAPATGFGFDDDVDETEVTVAAGEEGTIVEEFDQPSLAYLVEFADDYGETTAMVTLTADQFDVVWRVGMPVAQRVGV